MISASMAASRRTFSTDAVTRTVPVTGSSAAATGAGTGAADGEGGGAGVAQATKKIRGKTRRMGARSYATPHRRHDDPQFVHQARKLIRIERLRPIAHRLFRIVVH